MSDGTMVSEDELARRVRAALEQEPGRMTGQLARQFEVPEARIIRALPGERVRELDVDRWEELFRAFEEVGLLHVIVSSGAVTMERFGRFGNFSRTGPFFNVQTSSLDLHIRPERLGACFAVEKPSHTDERRTYSFQFFDTEGHAAIKVFFNFGESARRERLERFQALRRKFARTELPSDKQHEEESA